MFFACFRPYDGQPDNHIGWATLMPFSSINPTDPITNLAQFHEKILGNDGFEKCSFFELAILEFFFQTKKKLLNPMKSSQRFFGSKDGSKFLCLLWFPAHEGLGSKNNQKLNETLYRQFTKLAACSPINAITLIPSSREILGRWLEAGANVSHPLHIGNFCMILSEKHLTEL